MRKSAIPTAATAVLVAAITLAGGVVRFWQIESRGPFLWDDAILHLESIFLLDSARFLKESVQRKAEEARTGQDLWTLQGEGKRFHDEVGGISLRHGRPGQNLILVAAMAILGRVDWAGPASSALLGTLTIPAVFLLARKLFGRRRPALFAAAGLAALGYHVRFSREGLPEANSLLFVSLAMLAYTRSRDDLAPSSPPHAEEGRGLGRSAWLAISGFLTGVAFTIQDRSLLLFPVILVCEIGSGGLRRGSRRFAAFFSLACLPILAFELPYYAIMLALRRHGIALPYRTYLEQVAAVIANHIFAHRYYSVSVLARAAGLAAYPYLFTRMGGWPFALLAAGGIAVAGWLRPSPAGRLLVIWCVFCWVFLSLTVPFARYASIFLVPLVLLAALALDSLCQRLLGPEPGPPGPGDGEGRANAARGQRARLVLCACLATLTLVWEGCLSRRIACGVRPGYEEAVSWIAANSPGGAARHVSTQPYVSMVYAGVGQVSEAPYDWATLDRLRASGYRYYLVDLIRAFSLGPFAPRAAMIDKLGTSCTPARVFPNAWAAWPEYLFEFNFDTLRTWRLLAKPPAWLGSIEVYDLEACMPPAPPSRSPSPSPGPD